MKHLAVFIQGICVALAAAALKLPAFSPEWFVFVFTINLAISVRAPK